MDYSSFVTTDSPRITVEAINGDLIIKGWERPEIRVDSDSKNSLVTSYNENHLTIRSDASVAVRAPIDSLIHISLVSGDLHVKSIEGDLDCKSVEGNAVFKNTGNVEIGNISGNMIAKAIVGNLSIKQVTGNLNASRIEGDLEVDTVNGNTYVQDAEGDILLKAVNGNATFQKVAQDLKVSANGNVAIKAEADMNVNYDIHADGKVQCRLVIASGAKLHFKSQSERIRIELPDLKQETSQQVFDYIYLDPDSEISISAMDSIDFELRDSMSAQDMGLDWNYNFGNITDEINDLVNLKLEENWGAISAQMENLASSFEDKAYLTEHYMEKNHEKIRRQAEKAARRAEQKARLAIERSKAKSRQYRYVPRNQQIKDDPVTDSERQMVLKMLENKQITIDEAERLFAAMEGREYRSQVPSAKSQGTSDTGLSETMVPDEPINE
ncbi:MAG: hypothetical protein JXA19_00310 [Anaerolineales bacterium]|nr:hypothetical protein [Anaerolineales bacterium]